MADDAPVGVGREVVGSAEMVASSGPHNAVDCGAVVTPADGARSIRRPDAAYRQAMRSRRRPHQSQDDEQPAAVLQAWGSPLTAGSPSVPPAEL